MDSVWKYGNYINNKKNGDWLYNKTILNNKGIPYQKEIYKNDILQKTESLNLLEGNPPEISRKISGKWEVINAEMPVFDSAVYFRKIQENQSPYFKFYIKIDTTGKGYIFAGQQHGTRKYDFSWSLTTDNGRNKIIISIPNLFMKCTIIYLSKEMLVGIFNELQRLKY